MRDQMYRNNALAVRFDNGSLSSCSQYRKIIGSSFNFPQMSFDEILRLFFGTHQIKTDRIYVEEHISNDNDYTIEVNDSNDSIVRACNLYRVGTRNPNSPRDLPACLYLPDYDRSRS